MDALYLVAGLGNPGPEYSHTRHNAGFLAAEVLAREAGANWKQEGKFQSRVGRGSLGGKTVILCQPQTYMNRSGSAVGALAGFYKIPADRVLILVDDADLVFGQIRLRPGGSSGGHHGLDSVESALSSRDYPRLRIGIGRTERGLREITGHVLGRFTAEEQPMLEKVLGRVAAQVKCLLSEGIGKAMSQFNGAVEAPPKKEEK